MKTSHSILDTARADAQALHRKISADMAKAGAATWADVEAVQAEAMSLSTKMKDVAAGQADAMKADIKVGITALEEAASRARGKAQATLDDVKRANSVLLAAVHRATQSLSHAVADLRHRTAKAIEPKKVQA